jgi:hypothetical protein
MTERFVGTLVFWRLSERGQRSTTGGGFGLVSANGEHFFLTKNRILSGEPLPGNQVSFTALPKLPDEEHRKASEAVISRPLRKKAA